MTSRVDTPTAKSTTGYAPRLPLTKLWYGLLFLPLLAVLAFVIFQPVQVLPRMELAPGFTLIDQHGARFTNEDLRGKLTLYTFTHTRCGENCPDTSAVMRAVQAEIDTLDLGGLAPAFVSISFDPAYDTPERLAAYARAVGADGTTWRFATGDPDQLKQIIGAGFRTYYQEREGGAFDYDPVFVLVDGWGIQRAVYRTATPDIDMIRRDFGLIAREVENSVGVNRFAYEAAHLFLCYPS
jgi:protein SCO1